jgi:hypothetical protein
LAQKCKRLQIRCNRLKEELKIKKEKNYESSKWQCTMQQIITDANNMNPRAILILDQIKNYNKKKSKMVRNDHSSVHCMAILFSKGL